MAVAPGTRFGAYEITGELGVGGMGEVYRATDTNLKRDVAIKILPPAFAGDADRVARFQREAEALAALNHPNIAQIYGLERGEGMTAIAMELVEGPTLADRIATGPIAAEEALQIALQIADALEAAHERSIVHRDLKPANVKLKPNGMVKVLDFGIATAPESPIVTSGRHSPTLLTPALTEAGVLLGTAAYMSPEQARGRGVDARADVWAFGCVLFEMLTGQPAFGGEDVTTTVARVLEREPNLAALPAATPAPMKRAIELCLRKDPRKRLHSIGDVRLGLEGELGGGAAESSAVRASPPGRRALPIVAALAAGAAIVGATWRSLRPAEERPRVTRFVESVAVPSGLPAASLSSDGSLIAYVSGTPAQIRLRNLASFETVPIDTSAGSLTPPCFSPDGKWIAFAAENSTALRKAPVAGGRGLTLASGLFGLDLCDWGEDGYIYFTTTQGIARVPEAGGSVESLAAPDVAKREISFERPQLLPGGTKVLYSVVIGGQNAGIRIEVMDLTTHAQTPLLDAAGIGAFAATGPTQRIGHLVYGQGGALFAAPVDLQRLRAGAVSPILDGVVGAGPLTIATVSPSGTLAYFAGEATNVTPALTWVSRDGSSEALPGDPAYIGDVSLSRNGKNAVTTVLDLNTLTADLWVHEFDTGRVTRLTFGGFNRNATWTPDGKRLLYASSSTIGDPAALRSVLTDGSGLPVTLLAAQAGLIGPTSVSPDGNSVLGVSNARANAGDVWWLPFASVPPNGAPSTDPSLNYLLDSAFDETHASISPDGRWVAYSSNETGREQIFVVPYPGPGGKTQVSLNGGREPRWNPNGRELFYVSGSRMMSVAVETTPAFRAATPTVLFDDPSLFEESMGSPSGFHYDVVPDGSRFLLLRPRGRAGGLELRVVQNWFEELRKLAPFPADW
jgi:Tol biopolymer transport system component